MSKSVLRVEGLNKSFGQLQALNGVDFNVKDGQLVGLIGPNGSGKSTSFNCISGMLSQDSGSVILNDKNIEDLEPYQINQMGLARTFQNTRLWRELSVIENLLLAPKKQPGSSLWRNFLRPLKVKKHEEELIDKALGILEFLEISHMKNNYCSELSGGQSKLVDLGRVLMNAPDVLLLDEPVAGVAPPLAEKIFEHISNLNEEGITVVIIEHNMDFILRHEIENIFVMNKGKIIADGSPDEIREMEEVQKAYLGE